MISDICQILIVVSPQVQIPSLEGKGEACFMKDSLRRFEMYRIMEPHPLRFSE